MLLQTVERDELKPIFSYLARSLVQNFIGYGAHVNVSEDVSSAAKLRGTLERRSTVP